MHPLTTPEEVDRFIHDHPVAAIFKAGTCHKTMQGWGNLERMLRDRPQIPVGIIRVVEHRPASNRVAELTGITHHSPQVIVFRDGQPVFDLDNWDITLEKLEPLFQQHLPDVKVEPSRGHGSNLEPYKRLLDAYLGGAVSEAQFQWAYLNMFREDASLRSHEEFDLLNALFGNPDAHHVHPEGDPLQDRASPAHRKAILQHEQQNPPALSLRERAAALREKLEALEASMADSR